MGFYLYISLGVFTVVCICFSLLYFWIKAGNEKSAKETRDRLIADLNQERITQAIAQRVAEHTAKIEAEKENKEIAKDLDKGKLTYFDNHPFS